MCWSATASVAMAGLGAAAVVITRHRGEPAAIWLTLGYFTGMELLQAAGYLVVDQCGSPANRAITLLSYLHITFQPLVINAFVMEIAPEPVSRAKRRWVFAAAGLCSLLLLARLLPWEVLGRCAPGAVMCGPDFCLVSGTWHIGWEVPLNDPYRPLSALLGFAPQFPAYLAAVFLLPLTYGAWRFVLFNLVAGPVLAMALTSDPREMPAVWCLFSVGLLLISLSPWVRYGVMAAHRRPA